MLNTVPRPAGASSDSDHAALTVRIPAELLERIKELARKEERSLNFIAARLLREAMDKGQEKRCR